jgi:hypothetical protein
MGDAILAKRKANLGLPTVIDCAAFLSKGFFILSVADSDAFTKEGAPASSAPSINLSIGFLISKPNAGYVAATGRGPSAAATVLRAAFLTGLIASEPAAAAPAAFSPVVNPVDC